MSNLEIISISLNVVLILIVLFAKAFVSSWVKSSVEETFKINSEKREQEHTRKLKAELVADLIAEWTTPTEDRKRLRELTLKSFIWLPKNIAEEVSGVLSHSQPNFRKVIGMVREHLLEEQLSGDALDYNKVISFGLTPHEKKIKEKNDN
ncbi:hypothetical protein [Erwinia sp. OPT-41]|uniref:Uncharacterized protein n=1 Tax=Erwinia plantamica TaxID=3237104 RepID=A0ABW7CLS3_9GAMM